MKSPAASTVLSRRYRLEDELGRGAMGIVYRAWDLRHRREVAVKVLAPALSAKLSADRFLSEIEAAARLQHPNILPLHDSGDHEGTLFYVTPRIRGESLEERLWQQGPLGVGEAVRIAREVAGALAHAHARGVVHRDVKPANILLDAEGHVYLADFGIARALWTEASARLTRPGSAVGSPTYMSPEQCAGQAEVDGRSDIYSLGCVLYEILTGSPPFEGETVQKVLSLHLTQPPPPLRSRRADVPPELERVVLKALAKDPSDRFSLAESLEGALGSAVAEDVHELSSTPGPLDEKAKPRSRRLGTIAWLAVAAIAALVGGMPILGWLDARRPDLAPNKVMVFPLGDRGGGGLNGAEAALAIITAFEHADPLRPLDGWDRLMPQQRENIDLLPPGEARDIAVAGRAGHYLTGAITRRRDSLGVSLALYETAADTAVARATASGPYAEEALSQLAIEATVGLLPTLFDPGRKVELRALTDRNPTAIAYWIQGEREYRLSRFAEALDAYEAALETDSLLVLAALKGAQAASWIKEWDQAEELLEAALPHSELLPPHHRHFARGLHHFTQARSDSAVHHLRAALEEEEEWGEAWMALGESYHHLFPKDLVVDSSDLASFRRARELDPGFYPPLIHLAEDAIRKGDVVRAAEHLNELASVDAYPSTLRRLQMMSECVDRGAERMSWGGSAAADPLLLLDAGRQLAVGGYQTRCAKGAFRAVIDAPHVPRNVAWGAIQGLQGLLVSEARYPEALALLDSAVAEGYGSAELYIVLDVVVGAPWADRATAIADRVEERYQGEFGRMGTLGLSVLGTWHAHRADASALRAVLRPLQEKAGGNDVRARTYAAALEGQLLLLLGDTVGAIAELDEASPDGDRVELAWSVTSPLPQRHLTLAELLLARGRYGEALRIAALFDHPEPVVYLPFLRKSLEIRLEAAKRLRRPTAVETYETRLLGIGAAP